VGHGHSHGVTATAAHRPRLLAVLAITLTVMLAEAVGGVLSGSWALLADAGHMLTDAGAVGAALLASVLAARPATSRRTFGLQRAEILAALGNGLLLVVVAVVVLVEAVDRWRSPADVDTGLMLAVAVAGVVANGVSLLLLRRGQARSLNVRGAYLEVLGDLLGSVAVVVAAVVLASTGYLRADALASVAIALLIVPRAVALLREVVDVLLEAAPAHVDLAHVRAHILSVAGVVDVHDLHAWTITSGVPVLSAHVVVDAECIAHGRSGEVLDRLGACLAGHFDVAHCTFQLEPVGHVDHEPAQHS
jgi:cobalt-zinc-cadmium efflux system protein